MVRFIALCRSSFVKLLKIAFLKTTPGLLLLILKHCQEVWTNLGLANISNTSWGLGEDEVTLFTYYFILTNLKLWVKTRPHLRKDIFPINFARNEVSRQPFYSFLNFLCMNEILRRWQIGLTVFWQPFMWPISGQ